MAGLAGTAAKLLASLDLDTKPFERGAARAGASLGKMESRFSRIGNIAQRGLQSAATNLTRIGLAAGVFIAGNVAQGVRSLENLERVTNATAGVIKSTGGAAGVSAQQVRDLAESLEALTTADDKAIQEGENMLLTFTSIGKETFPRAATAVTNMAIAMADGNVESANFSKTAIQVGKALNDPIRGITALRKNGVQFTEEQQKQIKTLVESGKTVEAQRMILAELEKEFGKAGEAAGKGFGGDMRRFKDAVEGAQMALAKGLLPVISNASKWLTTKLADPAVMKQIEDFGVSLAGSFDKLVALGGRIPWQQIGDSMKLAGAGAKAAFDLFTGLPPWVQTAVVTGWGLNKLTGGALGSIVGELGKGLVKGVLGMTAGVVNIRAGAVTGMGGVGGAGGAAGAAATSGMAYRAGTIIGTAIKVFGVLAIAELADQLHGEISGLGSELGKKVPILLAERLALGKAISELYWPFGPKGAPEWAGGTGVFGDGGHLMGTRERVSRAPAPGTPITRTGHGSTQTAEETRSSIDWSKIATKTSTPIVEALHKLEWKPSTTVQVEDRRNEGFTQTIAEHTKASVDWLSEADRNALAVKRAAERQTTRIEAMKGAMARDLSGLRSQTRASGASIVGAIRALDLAPKVFVTVSGNTVRTSYSTGGTVARNVNPNYLKAGI